MAKQRESKIVGTVGNIIFYNRLGEYCMRIKPAYVRRTGASVHSGLNFGKASRVGKQIRNLVRLIYPTKSDNLIINRLNGEINKFISWKEKATVTFKKMPPKLPFIYGFQFNTEADLSSISAIQPIVKSSDPGVIEINFAPFIPNKTLRIPPETKNILFKIILVKANLEKAETELLDKSELEIPDTSESFQPASIKNAGDTNPGDLIILIMSVQYMVNRNGDLQMLSDKKKLPCGIAWAGII